MALQVTQQCNLRCEYCVYSGGYLNRGHNNKKMTFEVAKRSIDFLISHSRDSSNIALGFYGGEPLLQFDLIKKCVEYLEENAEGKEFIFNITVNGTLLTDEIVEFLIDHNFYLMISLDGPKEVHDKSRKFAGNGCGTFNTVMQNIERIKEKYPEFHKRITFSVVMNTENSFKCIDEFFTTYETIKNSTKNVSSLSTVYTNNQNHTTNENFILEKGYEDFKVFLHILKRLDKKYVSAISLEYFNHIKQYMFDYRKPTTKLPEYGHHSGPCIPGVNRLFVDVDGNLFPCEKVSENSKMMKIGNIKDGFEIEKCRKLLNIGTLTEKSCKNCWATNFCTLCAAYADDLNGLNSDKKQAECVKVKLNTEELFKDFIMLNEFGYVFDNKTFATTNSVNMEEA